MKGGKLMTLQGKHGSIASGIKSGKSNAALAKELGVSHGMIQKHRSGITGNRGNFPSGVTTSGGHRDVEEYIRMINDPEFKQREKLVKWFEENEMECVSCGVMTNFGRCFLKPQASCLMAR